MVTKTKLHAAFELRPSGHLNKTAVRTAQILEFAATVAPMQGAVASREKLVVGENYIALFAANDDFGTDQMTDITAATIGHELVQATPCVANGRAENRDTMLDGANNLSLRIA